MYVPTKNSVFWIGNLVFCSHLGHDDGTGHYQNLECIDPISVMQWNTLVRRAK